MKRLGKKMALFFFLLNGGIIKDFPLVGTDNRNGRGLFPGAGGKK